MESVRFDRLTRGIASAATGTRRAALAALALTALLGRGAGQETAAKPRRKKRRRRRFDPDACFGKTLCAFDGPGNDYDGCDFSGTSVFSEQNAGGSSFRKANFNGADLRGANIQGTKFQDADLRGADFRGADIGGGEMPFSCLFDANLRNMIFTTPFLATSYLCNTIAPDGIILNRDCNTAPRCCYT
jgi:hypothetical protein